MQLDPVRLVRCEPRNLLRLGGAGAFAARGRRRRRLAADRHLLRLGRGVLVLVLVTADDRQHHSQRRYGNPLAHRELLRLRDAQPHSRPPPRGGPLACKPSRNIAKMAKPRAGEKQQDGAVTINSCERRPPADSQGAACVVAIMAARRQVCSGGGGNFRNGGSDCIGMVKTVCRADLCCERHASLDGAAVKSYPCPRFFIEKGGRVTIWVKGNATSGCVDYFCAVGFIPCEFATIFTRSGLLC